MTNTIQPERPWLTDGRIDSDRPGQNGHAQDRWARPATVSAKPAVIFPAGDSGTRQAFELARKVAPTDAAILLLGESGTGKSMLAREIHRRSHRSGHRLVTVSCPSLSRDLLESELFGHVRGAFTGAARDRHGKVSAAAGGTLLLDEIGDLTPEIQPKLLRLLQEGEYERLGESKTHHADVRVISATNSSLRRKIQNGTFREDLFYRLNVITIHLPPLRDRIADLDDLAECFLRQACQRHRKSIRAFSPEVRRRMRAHDWPGNLRELNNFVERAVILCEGDEIQPAHVADCEWHPVRQRLIPGDLVSLHRLEQEHIRLVLERTQTQQEAARILEVDPATLYRRRRRQQISAAAAHVNGFDEIRNNRSRAEV